MAIRVSDLALPVDEPEASLPDHVAQVLGVKRDDIHRWRILRKSLDLRNKEALRFVYAVEAELTEDEADVLRNAGVKPPLRIEPYRETPFTMPVPGKRLLTERPAIVGAGPAGMVAAYFLAESGYRPLVLERGKAVRDRIHDVRCFDGGGPLNPESNYLFGEGGAGTFSDGKLTCRSSGPDVQRVLQLFAACKGKPSLLYDYRPHLGSNRLPAVVKALRQRALELGAEFRFSCRVEDLDLRDGALRGLATSAGHVPAQVALLATGHSARDTYEMLQRRGLPLVAKPFQFGVRIEQPQEAVNRVQYGRERWEETLGAADYALVVRGGHDLFSFCMCAGGQVIPSVSEPGHFCTNGMSLSHRDSPFANSGLMVTLDPRDFGSDLFAGLQLQRRFEQRAFEAGRGEYLCPIQRAKDFLAHRATRDIPASSYQRGLALAEIAELLPAVVREALERGLPILDRRWHGRFLRDATLVGPEARGSAPVRLLRDPVSREAPGLEGVYPVGEGAGYAGGIISAAVDGLRTAKAIVAKYARPDRR